MKKLFLFLLHFIVYVPLLAQNPYPVAVPKPNIVGYEYYLNTDPGIGNATLVNFVSADTLINNIASTINFSTLAPGIHRLGIRCLDANNRWSQTNIINFENMASQLGYPTAAILPNLIKLQYGIKEIQTNSNIVNTTNDTLINNSSFNLAIPSSLEQGIHQLMVRTLNAQGRWSQINSSIFYKGDVPAYTSATNLANITRVEYAIDTDPGYGNGIPFNFVYNNTINFIDSIINLPSNLSLGTHKLYMRTRDANGRWSLTAIKTFNVFSFPYTIAPNVKNYGNVATGVTKLDSFKLKNISNVSKLINSISLPTGFTTTFAGPVSLAAGDSMYIKINFAPTNTLYYTGLATILTNDSTIKFTLQGTGVTPAPAWTFSGATSLAFPYTAVGSSSTNYYNIHNTGNTPISVSSSVFQGVNNTYFTDSIYSTVLQIGAYVQVRVKYAPLNVADDEVKYVIKGTSLSTISAIDSLYIPVTGNGYFPGPFPTLNTVATTPYNGSGVWPTAGAPGTSFSYMVRYSSASNHPPMQGFPKVGIDINGDGDVLDFNEGFFTMSKVGSGNNYVGGEYYTFSTSFADVNNTYKYRFITRDSLGRNALINPVTNPNVTYDLMDLKIFANNISFSKANPAVNEVFTMYATIINGGPFTANNVPVKIYRDTVLLDSMVVASIAPYSSANITKLMSFNTDGFYPIKIWIDSANTLNDNVPLNNYAIRPILVGQFTLPGGINVSYNAPVVLYCPSRLLISGTAQYFGTTFPVQPMVGGGQVTVNRIGNNNFSSGSYITTTNGDGYFSYEIPAGSCGVNMAMLYNVVVTDFTVTKIAPQSVANIICPAVPCPSSGGSGGGNDDNEEETAYQEEEQGPGGPNPCIFTAADTVKFKISSLYPRRNLNNVNSVYDFVIADTCKIEINNALAFIDIGPQDSTRIGDTVKFAYNFLPTNTGVHNYELVIKYKYVRFNQAPSVGYAGDTATYIYTKSGQFYINNALPNYNVTMVQQDFRKFLFTINNENCAYKKSKTLSCKLYDSIPNSPSYVLLQTNNITLINATTLLADHPTMAYGIHYLKFVLDDSNTVNEFDENDNILIRQVLVNYPDLEILALLPSNNAPNIGSTINYGVIVENKNGTMLSDYMASASINSVSISQPMQGTALMGVYLAPGSTTPLSSINFFKDTLYTDPFLISTADSGCPLLINFMADYLNTVPESNEVNNTKSLAFGVDLEPNLEPNDTSIKFTFIKGIIGKLSLKIKNNGLRNATFVNSALYYNNLPIAYDVKPIVYTKDANIPDTLVSFYVTFNDTGKIALTYKVDTTNKHCEINETNNTRTFYIYVDQGKPDLEVLSQYISPSSLNPAMGQNITVVSTVKNIGIQKSGPSALRMLVDGTQLGADIIIDSLRPGQDTAVMATSTYSSGVAGLRVIELKADVTNTNVEIREDNNLATRSFIVGAAPDFARSKSQGVVLTPNQFVIGDSVFITNRIRNFGGLLGTAWLLINVYDNAGSFVFKDSVQFSLNPADSGQVGKKFFMPVQDGRVITHIAYSNPAEFRDDNNTDTAYFGKGLGDTAIYINYCGNNYVLPNGLVVSNSGIYIANFNNADSTVLYYLTLNKASLPSTITIPPVCDSVVLPNGVILKSPNNSLFNYNTSYINAVGCDSIVTYNLMIKKTSNTNVFFVNICNQYILPGTNDTAKNSGVYSHTYVNSVGCDSIVQYNVNILSVPVFTNLNQGSSMVCPGNSQLLTATVSNATSFSWTLPVGWLGASDSASINVTVDNNPGMVTVLASNACGNSMPATFSIGFPIIDDGLACTADFCINGVASHTIEAQGIVCRASAGACDVAEVCNGTNAACPTDVFLSNNTTCRASAGACDVAEVCNGTNAACPTDVFLASNTTCRASAGACDVAEVCNGTNAACPTDVFLSNNTTCRASAGVCDIAEVCNGINATCPVDVQLSTSTLNKLDTLQNGSFVLLNGTVVNNAGTYSYSIKYTNTLCDSLIVTHIIISNAQQGVYLSAKVFLGGCYNNSQGLMWDSLRVNNLIPNSTPYAGLPYSAYLTQVGSSNEAVIGNVYTVSGNNAIVDWVFVQLRNKLNSSNVLASRSALLQRDGDVVDVDGVSSLYFPNISADNYFVSIKHRNHLGVMSKFAMPLTLTNTVINFTDTATQLFTLSGSAGNLVPLTGATKIINNKRLLYPGNCNVNLFNNAYKFVSYNSSSSSDRNALLAFTGATGTVYGYNIFDLDLNGYARFNGLNNDRLIISFTTNNSNIIIANEQTPN
jgi:hypothetical protein